MTTENPSEGQPINGMNLEQKPNGRRKRQPKALEGELVKRKLRRRLDLKTLHGTMRESARAYREFCEGKIDAFDYEVRSRGLSRHKEIVQAIEERDQLKHLTEQLQRLGALPSTPLLPLDVGDAATVVEQPYTEITPEPI